MVPNGRIMVTGTNLTKLNLHLHLPLQLQMVNLMVKKMVGYTFQTNARKIIMNVRFTLSSTKAMKMQVSLVNQKNTTSWDTSMILSWCTHKQRAGICRQTLLMLMLMQITKMEFYQVW